MPADGVPADVREYAAVEQAVQRCASSLGALDIVISGAAGSFVAEAAKLSANGLRTVQ